MSNDYQKNLQKYVVVILGITYVVCVAIIGFLHNFTSFDTVVADGDNWIDVKNWVSMVVTLIIPLGVAIVIWKYSHIHQQESSDILKNSAIRRNEKRVMLFPRISLQLKIIKQYLDERDFDLANERFVQTTSMIYAFEESLDSIELNNLVEVLEVGKVVSENQGSFPMRASGVFPSTFSSIPANLTAFLSQLESQINYYSTPPKKLAKCHCGSEMPCNIHVNEPVKHEDQK